MKHPLSREDARKAITTALNEGWINWGRHAEEEAQKDAMDFADCRNILRNGTIHEGRKHDLTWRYKVETARMGLACEIWAPDEVYIVTCWRVSER